MTTWAHYFLRRYYDTLTGNKTSLGRAYNQTRFVGDLTPARMLMRLVLQRTAGAPHIHLVPCHTLRGSGASGSGQQLFSPEHRLPRGNLPTLAVAK